MSQTNKASNTRKIAEAAVMLAVATVLSMIKLLDLPYGGTVTIGSLLPIIIISYRHGVKFGLLTGFVFGIIQQLLGLDTLSYVTTWQSVIAVIFLDYLIAFMLIGLGGAFKKFKSQPNALMIGTIAVCGMRYICHVISGATVWAGLSIPTNAALLYSIGYNATYMIPETIVTAALAYYIGSILDFRNESISRFSKPERPEVPALKWLGGFIIIAAIAFDVRTIFLHLQNGETGEFYVMGFASVNWGLIALVSIVAIISSTVLISVSSKNYSD